MNFCSQPSTPLKSTYQPNASYTYRPSFDAQREFLAAQAAFEQQKAAYDREKERKKAELVQKTLELEQKAAFLNKWQRDLDQSQRTLQKAADDLRTEQRTWNARQDYERRQFEARARQQEEQRRKRHDDMNRRRAKAEAETKTRAEQKRREEQERRRREYEAQQKAKEAQARADEEQKQVAEHYRLWKQKCDMMFNGKMEIYVFPHLPLAAVYCRDVSCAARKATAGSLMACRHDVERLLRGSGQYSREWLRKERLAWHPDRFGRRCNADFRKELNKKAEELYMVFEQLLSDV